MDKRLKPEQELAIMTKDADIILSAGAGSGKTFVMIERIVHNITQEHKSVGELLVVTFTNAAAAEMRSKLERKLTAKLTDPDTPDEVRTHIATQLETIGQADICTLHKFCQNLIRKYFYVTELDPGFLVADENESRVLKSQAIADVIDDLTAAGDKDFALFLRNFDAKRNFDKIKTLVLDTQEFLNNQTGVREFVEKVDLAYEADFDNSEFCKCINAYVSDVFAYYRIQFEDVKDNSERVGYKALAEMCEVMLAILNGVRSENTFTQNHAYVYEIPRMPNIAKETDDPEGMSLREVAASLKDRFSKELKNLREKVLLSSDIADLKSDLKSSQNVMHTVFRVVDLFEKRYSQLKLTRTLLDFNDLEHYALRILDDENVVQQVRNTYSQVYVDEYQDINDIQESILIKVAGERNLFLVGDVKQSIYGFRNTNPEIFLEKNRRFGECEDKSKLALPLNYNFRSDLRVLEFINFVFSRLMTKTTSSINYKETSLLRAGLEFKRSGESMPVIEVDIVRPPEKAEELLEIEGVYSIRDAKIMEENRYVEAYGEARIIAKRIAELMNTQKVIFDPECVENDGFRPIEYRDITLLARSRSAYLDTLCKELSVLGVPLATLARDSVFDEYEVQILYSFLNLLNNFEDDINLTAFLLSPVVGLTESDLGEIRLNSPEEKYFYACVRNYLTKQDPIKEKLDYALELIEKSKLELLNSTIYTMLNKFIERTNYDALIAALSGGIVRVKNIQGYIAGFVGRSYNTDLYAYLNYIENADSSPKIEAEKNISDNVVHVETMHSSKGLEYPIVFLVDTGRTFNRESLMGDCLFSNSLGLGLYSYDPDKRVRTSTLARSAIKLTLEDKNFAENLRLLYVATTRAKNHLYIIGKCKTAGLEFSPTDYSLKMKDSYLELILATLSRDQTDALREGKNKMIINPGRDDEFVICAYDSPVVLDNEWQKPDLSAKTTGKVAEFDSLLGNYCNFEYPQKRQTTTAFKNSVTSLMSLDEENTAYMFKDTLRDEELTEGIDTEKAALKGIAYHKAMEIMDFELDSREEIEEFLHNNLGFEEFSLIDCDKILACVRNLRPIVLNADKVLREQKFLMYIPHKELVKDSEIEDKILVQGIVDLVVLKEGKATLLDYKMTKIKDPEKLRKKYDLQLHCYQKAVESALNCTVTQKIIYSFSQELQISFDK